MSNWQLATGNWQAATSLRLRPYLIRFMTTLTALALLAGCGEALVDSPEDRESIAVNEGSAWTVDQGSNWIRHFRSRDLNSFTSATSCEATIPRTLDVSYWDLAGAPEAILGFIADEGEFQRLVVLRADLRSEFAALGRVPLEAMFEEELPFSMAEKPLAMAIGEAPSLPTVPNGSGSEHGLAILYNSGSIRMYGQDDAALAASARVWPSGYTETGAVGVPSLPAGVTRREYCDVEILQDGDLVVTFAQWPGLTIPTGTYPREGWIRYDHATASWETAVTGASGYSFLHPDNKSTTFDVSACMSVDTNYWAGYEVYFASNLSRSSSTTAGPTVWSFALNSSGPFALSNRSVVPMVSGDGNLQGIAAVYGGDVLVQQDYVPSADRIKLLDATTSPATLLVSAVTGLAELHAVVATGVQSSPGCYNYSAFTSREAGSASNTCEFLFEFAVRDCI